MNHCHSKPTTFFAKNSDKYRTIISGTLMKNCQSKFTPLRLKQHEIDSYAWQAVSQLKFAHKARNKETKNFGATFELSFGRLQILTTLFSNTSFVRNRNRRNFLQVTYPTRIFSESTCFLEFTLYHVVVTSQLVYSLRRLVGCISICLNVTA